MNLKLLQEMITAGYVNVQKHPIGELYIYNYGPRTQFERVWNEATLASRGLIMNAEHEIIARPFPKFFNLGELEVQQIPNGPFDVFEKMDGSLGILYWLGKEPYIATRGSFISEQAIRATELLHQNYASSIGRLDHNRTYLFEIIYPKNRIVVDYGDLEDLILLTTIDTKSGIDLGIQDIGFPLVKKYDGLKDLAELRNLEEINREGFVVKFKNDFRLKVKFAEYERLHRILTGVSNKTIWEFLRDNRPLDELLELVPDEFYRWVRQTQAQLLNQFSKIESIAQSEFKVFEDRKSTALYFKTCTYPSILFSMLDGKDYAPAIWRMIEPEYQKPFSR